MAERENAPPAPPAWWEGSTGRSVAPAEPHPRLPWTTGAGGAAPAQPGTRPGGRMLRPVVLIAAAALVVVAVLAAVAAVRGAGGDGLVTTPFLSYTTPPGWSAAPPDPAASAVEAPTLVGAVHGTRYACGGEEFVRGFAAAALLPADAAAAPADRAERMARWFADATFSAADGTPPEVSVAPPRPVAVAGPGGPVDGTVTEAVIRAHGGRDGCAATAGRVLVLAVPRSGGAALLLVAGDTEGGPAEPAAPDPSALEAVVGSARLTAG